MGGRRRRRRVGEVLAVCLHLFCEQLLGHGES